MAEFTPFPWSDLLGTLSAGADLSEERADAAMTEIMAGRASHAQIAAMILAMRIKGETVDEIVGLVRAMREAAVSVEVDDSVIVDTAGTGGDRSGTFNISTTAAFIAAGAGVRVAKHGNRAASSLSGSADLLEGLGVVIDLPPAATATLLKEAGFAFFFAPTYHPSMRYAAPVRTQLGVPTVFNFLGPLANPAGSRHQAVGVSDAAMAGKMIGALARLGAEYAFVYYGEDGLDEITTTGPSFIYRLRGGEITHAEFTPEDFGVPRATSEDLLGGTIEDNVAICRAILGGEPGPKRDIAVVNAAPAIVVAGLASGFEEAVGKAAASIDSGAAAARARQGHRAKPATRIRRLKAVHPSADDLVRTLRDRSLRITKARRAICEVLAASHEEHMSAADILERARTSAGVGIDQSTVYRTLDVLEEFGYLHHVHLGHGAGIYHLSEESDHQHLVCERCGTSVDIPLEELAPVLDTVTARYGFVAEGVHFALVGTCESCAGQVPDPGHANEL